jgi:hypothetical protein
MGVDIGACGVMGFSMVPAGILMPFKLNFLHLSSFKVPLFFKVH